MSSGNPITSSTTTTRGRDYDELGSAAAAAAVIAVTSASSDESPSTTQQKLIVTADGGDSGDSGEGNTASETSQETSITTAAANAADTPANVQMDQHVGDTKEDGEPCRLENSSAAGTDDSMQQQQQEQQQTQQQQHSQHPFRMKLKTTTISTATSHASSSSSSSTTLRKRKTASSSSSSSSFNPNVLEEEEDVETSRNNSSSSNKMAKTTTTTTDHHLTGDDDDAASNSSGGASSGDDDDYNNNNNIIINNIHVDRDDDEEDDGDIDYDNDNDVDDDVVAIMDEDAIISGNNNKQQQRVGGAGRRSHQKQQQQQQQRHAQEQALQEGDGADGSGDGNNRHTSSPQRQGQMTTTTTTTTTETAAAVTEQANNNSTSTVTDDGEGSNNNLQQSPNSSPPSSPTSSSPPSSNDAAASAAAAAAATSSPTTTTTANTSTATTTPPLEQPEGWRVKLYRLNADGSWDDCGTGRIMCHYHHRRPHPSSQQQQQRQQQQQHQQQQQQATSVDNNGENNNNGSGSSSSSSGSSDGVAEADGTGESNEAATNNATNTTKSAETNAATAQAQQQQHDNDSAAAAASQTTTTTTPGATTGSAPVHHNNNNTNNPDQWLYQETGDATLCVQAEVTKQNPKPRVLLRTRILLRDAYQRQGDNIITWCEPCFSSSSGQQQQSNNNNNRNSNTNASGMTCVDLALSFQDNAGCLYIWRQITEVQGRAAELLRQHQQQQHGRRRQSPSSLDADGGSMTATAAAVAAQHHADLDKQERDNFWNGNHNNRGGVMVSQQHQHHHHQHDHVDDEGEDGENVFMDGSQGGGIGIVPSSCSSMPVVAMQSLPDPPTLQNLEEIADGIAALQHVQQRDSLAMWIAKDECSYLKALLGLFPAAEDRGDYGKLATLAACVKTILLLNDPSILELIVTVADMFEQVCSCLEYDPDLREKANHRWFLRERAKFRTVVAMDDPDLVAAIHRSFRVNYLRDTLLRPTMDESSLSTLSSLQTFSHADVVKGVTMSSNGKEVSLTDSYLVRVIRMLGMELHALSVAEWADLELKHYRHQQQKLQQQLRQEHLEQQLQQQQPHHHHHHHHPSSTGGGGINESSKDSFSGGGSTMELCVEEEDLRTDPSIVVGKHSLGTATWKQYLAPQDNSLTSRRLRRRGCLSFLRELFNMVRLSLQQGDKDDFFSVICTLDIDLNEERDISDNVSQTSQTVEVGSVASTVRSDRLDEQGAHVELPAPTSPVNLLALLGNVLSDPNADVSEKGSVLEIIAGVAMHDPTFIRRHCLEHHVAWKKTRKDGSSNNNNNNNSNNTPALTTAISGRPEPSEKKQVIFFCPPNDLLASLIFLLDVETDAGVLLQVTEIMRIILDTDMMGCDSGSVNSGFADEADVPSVLGGHPHVGGGGNPLSSQHEPHQSPHSSVAASTDQKHFLSMFYEHYVEWLVAPFQFTILHPIRRVPDHVLRAPSESNLMQKILSNLQKGISQDDTMVRTVPSCGIRFSFAVELLSFCVRAHLYRMKFFLLKSRVLGSVLNLLRPSQRALIGDRCLKLAALRFLRSILSVNDEFYHRHIIQHNLFAPVFEAFRANPVGDNLVSSAIVEMCDYIHSENIKSLLEYIVTRHLSTTRRENEIPSLEDVSSPYVSTLTVLRKAYEDNLNATQRSQLILPNSNITDSGQASPGGSRYFPPTGGGGGGPQQPQHHHLHPHHPQQQHPHRPLSGAALEDQRKFREADEEESYFDSDDTDETPTISNTSSSSLHLAVDEVDVETNAGGLGGAAAAELRRTPRMFSMAHAPLINNLDESNATGGDGEAISPKTIIPEPSSTTMNDETQSPDDAALENHV